MGRIWLSVLAGGLVRYYLTTSSLAKQVSQRVEFSTPLNSYKRVLEGVHLLQLNINPYSGDVVHEIPILLSTLKLLIEATPLLVPALFILLDLLTALILHKLCALFMREQLEKESAVRTVFKKNTAELLYKATDQQELAEWVLLAYLFNPMTIFSCVGLTTTVFSNLMLAVFLYGLASRRLLVCLLPMVIESMRHFYPVVLILPFSLRFMHSKHCKSSVVLLTLLFGFCCAAFAVLNFLVAQSWNYVDGTLGFIFFYRDLQPNIGLFWYFFTEMFDHFRSLFLIAFQMNAVVVYSLPLALTLRKEPILLATTLISLMQVFRAYPSLGDVGFWLALLPLWRHCWKFLVKNYVLVCFFGISLALMGTLWHLWIYAGSANANFYFGATLAFNAGQIMLITDMLFAFARREYALYYGKG